MEKQTNTEQKNYTIFGVIEVKVFTEVKAKSEKEALEKASKLDNGCFEESDWLTSPKDLEVMK